MNKKLQDIINKHKQFKQYVDSIINIDNFNQYSYDEIKEFINELSKYIIINFPNKNLYDLRDKKKKEKYTELLDAYNYPELKELIFISKEDIIALDKYLAQLQVGSYIHTSSNAWEKVSKNWSKDIIENVFNFLENKNIIQKYYKFYICYSCNNYKLFSKKEIDDLLLYFEYQKRSNLTEQEAIQYNELESKFENNSSFECYTCDAEIIELDKNKILKILEINDCIYKLIKDRNRTYDNL